MTPLTWYPGTILPYASLWHTLLRATWLNDVRAGDIRNLVLGMRRRKGNVPLKDQGARDVKAVVSALGEPRRALSRLALIEQFPFSLRATCMAEALRWCPACIAGGYHTLLGSILLATRCPIHAVPLLDACPKCGDSFKMRFGGLAVRSHSCQCGRTRLLEPHSARQASLCADDVAAWAPVARWVRQVSNVMPSGSQTLGLPRQLHLAFAPRWSRDLGIAYPVCFDNQLSLWPDADEPGRWSTYAASSGDLRESRSAVRPDTRNFRPAPSQTLVYRAMGRHLRRHGAAHPDRWIKSLMNTFDPATFAMTMATRPMARVAFTEMLWSRRLEPAAVVRRWPNRPARLGTPDDAPWEHRTPILLRDGIGCIARDGPSITSQARRWVEYHAMAMEARLAWDQAWRQTQKSIEDEWADWSTANSGSGGDPQPGRILWFCRPKGHGMQFVGYVRDAVSAPFSAGAPTKQQRCNALAEVRLQPRRRIEALAHRQCLGWSRADGWRVEQGACPDGDDVRRVALLGSGQRTACWIFKSNDRFVARLVDGIIQVSGSTVSEALSGLRGAVIQYRRTYDAEHASMAQRPARFAPVSPEREQATHELTMLARQVRRKERFWLVGAMIRHGGSRRSNAKVEKRDA